MRLDSSGNLGLGVTPSAWGSGWTALQVKQGGASIWSDGAQRFFLGGNNYYNGTNRIYQNTGAATEYSQSGGVHAWSTAPSGTAGNAITFTQAMTLDASGNLLLGTTSSSSQSGTFGQSIRGSSPGLTLIGTETSARIYTMFESGGALTFFDGTAGSERARIDSSGNLLVGTTSAVGSEKFLVRQTASAYVGRLANDSATAANCFGQFLWYSGAAPNGTGNQFLRCDDNAATRAEIRSNGGIANYSGNNVNLSDRREKTNFAPAKSYLETICAIPVQTFNYIDQNNEEDPGLTLGVVAQDVQAVAPELVMESSWGTEDNPKQRLSIYQTDLQYALMKALQELKAEFDAYKATHP
jgi:hypothetical protein